ncbi:MAG: hypothetical protein GYB67_05330 [Chloroflexi bacterium]|nr:hypothetical protein [Chloroflexota bacterium]
MRNWFFLMVLVVLLAACQAAPATPIPTVAPLDQTLNQTLPRTNAALPASPLEVEPAAMDSSSDESVNTAFNDADAERLATVMHGVRLSLAIPRGWQAAVNDGLILAEHTVSVETPTPVVGMLVYVFVPPLNELDLSRVADGQNRAWAVLNQVVSNPNQVGRDVAISAPISFEWAGHDAAYYLLTGQDQTKTFVLALALPDSEQVVVCNISVPANDHSLYTRLPHVLDGLMIDGTRFDGALLREMVAPLAFPTRQPAAAHFPTDTPSVLE